MAGSSGLPWARAALKAGLISRRQMAGWAIGGLRFRLRGSTDEATERVLAEIKELLRGTSARDLARMAPEVLVGVLPRIYPEMLDEVYAHQDEGRPTFIVSAAGDDLVQLLARILLMDGGIGTPYEVDEDGRFTGELAGAFMYGEGKVEAMRRFSAEHDIDLASSWAYSDSGSDLPMLRAVGHPVAVNPDQELAEIARAGDWRVMRADRLARRLAIAGFTLLAALLGLAGGSRAALRGRISSRAARPSRA